MSEDGDAPVLGHLGAFPDGAVTRLRVQAGGKTIGLVVLRQCGALRAYLDLCPHQYLPLTWRGAGVLSADGTRIRCSVHGAEFAAEDGRALAGVPEGCRLTPAPLEVAPDGTVRLAGVPTPL
ncbi:Rieske (2Fe-2S) protein [Roseomonas sp. CCTCC AB2023176]|uniref:Rieske (2Fe-2S) protein n=1 Tax=Roseomonas sp. CCTCC AB2023176 TaxID=3342640 RepID=UPI0035DCCE23